MSYQYTPPEFLQGQTADVIHRRMLNNMPDDIDKSEPGIPWDFTRPAAIEKAEYVEFRLNEAIKLMFPHWAYDQWLDLHAGQEGLERRAANAATGNLTIIGAPGASIASGFQFATAANLTPSVIFEATADVTLDNGSCTITDTANPATPVMRLSLNQPNARQLTLSLGASQDDPDVGKLTIFDGTTVLEQFTFDMTVPDQVDALIDAVTTQGGAAFTLTKLADSAYPLAPINNALIGNIVPVKAVTGGTSGNVPPDTIILMVKPDTGIKYVTNPKATTGGTPGESNDELRERILEVKRYGVSFTGCDADYVRWGKEVPGVGQVIVDPEWDDPNLPEEFMWKDNVGNRHKAGAVRLFIIDANGIPANQQILDEVYNHIIIPDNRIKRLAPVGATLTVVAPVPLYVDISATVMPGENETMDIITDRFKANLERYWQAATSENDVFDVQTGFAQNIIKYVFVGAMLAATPGVTNYDHNTLFVNGGTVDIQIALGTYPVTREVSLSE